MAGADAIAGDAGRSLHHHVSGIFCNDGPLWNRFYSMSSESEVCPELQRVLQVGHGGYCSPRHGMSSNSWNQSSKCVSMT
jgi:hypothetical protein